LEPWRWWWQQREIRQTPCLGMSSLGQNGRWGNQLFQYAFLHFLARARGVEVRIPKWRGSRIFQIKDRSLLGRLPERMEHEFWADPPVYYDLTNGAEANFEVRGYFERHTSLYGQDREFFRSLFRWQPRVKRQGEKWLRELREEGKTLVGVHVRRGDYCDEHATCFPAPTEWYLDWLKEHWPKLDQPVLYVASDESERVRKDFSEYQARTATSLQWQGREADFLPDFWILAHADIVLISDSTFSLTAAMLNRRANGFFRPTAEGLKEFDPWNTPGRLLDGHPRPEGKISALRSEELGSRGQT
jgi:hypothetical protein